MSRLGIAALGLALLAQSTLTRPLTISPSTVTVATTGSQTFTTTGGAGGVTFSLSQNQTGGSVNSSTGAYLPGPLEGTDKVTATDSHGTTAVATITVTFTDPAVASQIGVFDPSVPANVTASGGVASAMANTGVATMGNMASSGGSQPGYGSTTINGKNTLHQAGSNFMTSTLAAQGDFHIMMVVNILSLPSTYHALVSFGQFQPALYCGGTNPDGYFRTGTPSTGDHNFTSLTLTTGVHLIEFWRTGSTVGCSIDGTDQSLTSANGSSTDANVAVMSSTQSGQEFGQMDVGESRFYSAALTGTNRSANRLRLRQKWATP